MRLAPTAIVAGFVGFQLAACSSAGGGGSTPEQSVPQQEPRTSIRIQGDIERLGGQTGGEGGCRPPSEQLPVFDAADVRALVLGRFETTLAQRAVWQLETDPSGAAGKHMVVEVSPLGEPEEYWSCLQRYIALPVEVKLSLDEPALDVIIQDTVTAYNAEAAGLNVDVPAHVFWQLGMLGQSDVPASEMERAEHAASLELWFGPDGPRGRVQSEGSCTSLVFPADRTCVSYGSLQLPASDALSEALQGFEELRALPVTLPDGTRTPLDVELLDAPESLCSGIEPGSPVQLAKVSAQLRSADGRIDLTVGGTFEFDITAPREALHFNVQGILPASRARTMPYFSALGEQQLVDLNFSASWRSVPEVMIFQGLELKTFDATPAGAQLTEPLWGASAELYATPQCIDESLLPTQDVGD